jgi:hypothetical protein
VGINASAKVHRRKSLPSAQRIRNCLRKSRMDSFGVQNIRLIQMIRQTRNGNGSSLCCPHRARPDAPGSIRGARISTRLLCTAHRLPVANDAVRLTALEDRLSLFLAIATARIMGAPEHHLAHVRIALGRESSPTPASFIVSQSVKTTGVRAVRVA